MKLREALEKQITYLQERIVSQQRMVERVQKLLTTLSDETCTLPVEQVWTVADCYDVDSRNHLDAILLQCPRGSIRRLAIDLDLNFEHYAHDVSRDGKATWKYRTCLDGFRLEAWTPPPPSCRIVPSGTREVTVWEVECEGKENQP